MLYTDCVPFKLVDSPALLRGNSCGRGGQIVFDHHNANGGAVANT
jgi:hypothetical protein